MTKEQIEIVDNLENWETRGYIVDVRWAFCGFDCRIWELHNDHDVDIDIKPSNGDHSFKSRWEAYKEALEYLNNKCNSVII